MTIFYCFGSLPSIAQVLEKPHAVFMNDKYIGIDIGGTKTAICAAHDEENIPDKHINMDYCKNKYQRQAIVGGYAGNGKKTKSF